MSRNRKVVLYALCVIVSFLQGCILMKGPRGLGEYVLYLGIPGAIPFLLFNGVHGDAEGIEGLVGGILYVLTNGAVYYGLIVFVRWMINRNRNKLPVEQSTL